MKSQMSRLLVGIINQVKFIVSTKVSILTISNFLHIRVLHIIRISVTGSQICTCGIQTYL